MRTFVPWLCLALALASLICGFVLLAVGQPDVDMELHRARISDDEEYRELLEERLERRRSSRRFLIGGLFGSAVLLTVTAFAVMPSARGSP